MKALLLLLLLLWLLIIIVVIRTAMQIAARNGSVAMLQMLQHYGGDLWSRGRRGETLLHLSANNGHLEAVIWLHRAGIILLYYII